MRIRRSESKDHVNGPHCVAHEYGHGDKDIDTAFIEITGRYPDRGRVMNRVCKEIVFVTKGRGRIEVDGEMMAVEEGDSIFIRPNQRFFFEGKLDIVVSCHPAWYPEQYRECE